jgi:hypothetical protein
MADEITYSPDEVSYDATPTDAAGPGPGGDLVDLKAGAKSGKYPKKAIADNFAAAKAVGVDPVTQVAIALQESGLGTVKVHGRRGTYEPDYSQMTFSDAQQEELDKLAAKTGIDPRALKLSIALRDKLQYAKDVKLNSSEALALQAFNGYGTITPQTFGGATEAYGVDITNGVNMKKNPLYGNRIIELKNNLLANDYVNSLLK